MSDDSLELRKLQLYTLTFENDPRAILVFGQGARVILVNRAADELLRRVGNELIDHFTSEERRAAAFAQFSRDVRLRGRARLELPLRSGPLTLEGRSHGDQIIVHLVGGGGRKGEREREREHVAETVRPPSVRLSSLPTTRPKAMLRTG